MKLDHSDPMIHYDTMAQAIDFLIAQGERDVSLSHAAEKFSLSPTLFQKQFSAYVGVSPAQFQRYLRQKQARAFLLQHYPTLEAAYAAGLSGNGRLHDHCLQIDAATPGEIRAKGQGMTVRVGWHDSPLGQVYIGETLKGICWLAFEYEGGRDKAENNLRAFLPYAEIVLDPAAVAHTASRIISLWETATAAQPVRLNLYGTNFQLKVWEALLRIPMGACVSYGAVAAAIGSPKASRAVGSAVGANPVSVLIPCHRVIQQSGVVENYGWGSARKKILLGLEGKGQYTKI